MKNWVKIASIYIGTVIGAGLASGREIIEFFGVYGFKGIWGMIIAGLLFSLVGSSLLIKVYDKKIEGFDELVSHLFGKKVGFFLDVIMTFSLYTGFSVKIAGSGAIFKEELGLSFNIGIVFMIICAFIVFLFSLEGMSLINSILVPLLIVGIIFTSFYVNMREGYNFSNIQGASITGKGNFLTSSLIIIVVFSSLLPLIDNKKTALLGGMSGGVILTILGISILVSILIYYNEVFVLDIPMLKICNYIGLGYRKSYAIILWIAMFTTALANGFGFMNRVSKGKNKMLMTALFCISAIPLAKVGFSNLVAILYPVFGFIGIVVMVFVLLY